MKVHHGNFTGITSKLFKRALPVALRSTMAGQLHCGTGDVPTGRTLASESVTRPPGPIVHTMAIRGTRAGWSTVTLTTTSAHSVTVSESQCACHGAAGVAAAAVWRWIFKLPYMLPALGTAGGTATVTVTPE